MAHKIYSPLVTIAIPVYNGSNYLNESISSALSQTYKNIEVIVVNDGSTDGGASREIAKSFGSKIRYFEKENRGVASALNLAISEMKGKWFSWLSHDDIYFPNKVARQIELLNKLIIEKPNLDPNKLIIYSNIEQINERGKKLIAPRVKLSDGLTNAHLILLNIKRNQFGGCTFLLPKECFNDVGVFNVALRTICDFDMWYRLLFADYEFHYISEVLVANRMHKNQVTQTMSGNHKNEYYAFHNWLIDNLFRIEKYRSEKTFLCLGKYMQRKNIPVADRAFDLAVKLSPAPALMKIKIKISRLASTIYYLTNHLIKRIYITVFVKSKIASIR